MLGGRETKLVCGMDFVKIGGEWVNSMSIQSVRRHPGKNYNEGYELFTLADGRQIKDFWEKNQENEQKFQVPGTLIGDKSGRLVGP